MKKMWHKIITLFIWGLLYIQKNKGNTTMDDEMDNEIRPDEVPDNDDSQEKPEDSFECSECGAKVPADANVCPQCGARFDEDDE